MPAPVKIVGGQKSQVPGIEVAADQNWGALFATLKPYDFVGPNGTPILGHYKLGMIFSNTAAAGTVPQVSFRWAPAISAYCIPTRVTWLQSWITTAFTTAQQIDLQMIIARAWTASDTGGTAITPITGNSQKNRSTMGTSLVTSILNGGVAIVAGTRTLDANAFAFAVEDTANTQNTAANALLSTPKEFIRPLVPGEHPLVLAPNEGFVLSPFTSLGAAGVVKYVIQIEWAEVVAF